MKKTITVNIGGFSFVINESAYALLQAYLKNVESKLSGDTDEIMQDIESRIAELLKERLIDNKEVVDESDIAFIQTIMGQPEDYDDGEGDDGQQATYEQATNTNEKALFRDMDNAMLGGVCSGLARYFNIDPLVMRILFVFFTIFLGSGLLLYIILLILIPEAKTTAQKLKMSGEAVNLESIKSHFNNLGNDLNSRIKSKQFSSKVNSATNKTVDAITSVASVFGKIIGVFFVIAGIVCLVFLVLYLTGSKDIIPFTSIIVADSFYDFLMVIFPTPLFANMALISVVFVTATPLFTFILSGLKLVFGLKTTMPKGASIAAGIVFGVAFSFLAISLARTGMEFSSDGSVQNLIESDNIEQLEIKILPDNQQFFRANSAYSCCNFMVIREQVMALKNISLYVEEANDSSTFSIKKTVISQGITTSKAIELADELTYDIALRENVLEMPAYSLIPRTSKYRAQRIKIVVRVPMGKSVKFSDDSHGLNCYVNGKKQQGHFKYDGEDGREAIWVAGDGRLKCEQCWD
ncbi:MAG: PspC domain-containing protein [Putridiphycobacter sp.]|nr:PspC domain-containing protein [Putridiphycobacter sp.]